MEKIVSITYIPDNSKVQTLVEFEYNGNIQYVIVLIDESALVKDFTKIAEDDNFISAKNEAITNKIIEINTPIPTI